MAVNSPSGWPTLDFYAYSPAEAAFVCTTVMDSMVRWRAAPAAVSTAYLLALRMGESHMAKRPPVLLPLLRTAWNAALSAFSLVVLSRVLPALLVRVAESGSIVEVACEAPELALGNGAPGLWSWLFVVAKVLELGDT